MCMPFSPQNTSTPTTREQATDRKCSMKLPPKQEEFFLLRDISRAISCKRATPPGVAFETRATLTLAAKV
eukprot:5447389-Amphidinium_carterae.1